MAGVRMSSVTIGVDTISLKLGHEAAWALCNLLADDAIKRSVALNVGQTKEMSKLGKNLGRLIEHESASNKKCDE